jgi:hypothetical protein
MWVIYWGKHSCLPQFFVVYIMTQLEWIAYLVEVDDAHNAEHPVGFKSSLAEQKFSGLVDGLNKHYRINLAIHSGKSIQDSSFHAESSIPAEWLIEHGYILKLRASNFGNLLAVVDDDGMIKTDYLNVIRQLAQEMHYRFVPTCVLLETYTGTNKGIEGFQNWMHRYFDWL